MTKFKNRKGLALGSIFALVISGFVGVMPAKAAVGDLIVEPMYGPTTNFTALASNSDTINNGMVMKTTYKAGAALDGDLKYKVTITTADLETASVSFAAWMTESTTAVVPNKTTTTAATVAAWGDTNAAEYDTTQVIKNANLGGTATVFNVLQLAAWRTDGVTTSFTVELTAWNDIIANDKIDTNETVISSPVTVTFVHPDAVAIGVSMTTPVIGDSTISARVTLGSLNLQNYVNVRGVTPKVNVGLAVNATRIDNASSSSAVANYDADLDQLRALIDVTGITASDTVLADTIYYAYVHMDGDAAAVATLGAPWAANVASTISTSSTINAATGATFSIAVVTGKSVAQDTGLTGANKIVALAGTTTLSFKFKGFTDPNTKSVAIGQGVVGTVTLTDVDLNTTVLTTPAGTTLAETGVNSRTFTVTSDINGEWSFDITATGAKAGDDFTIGFSSEGVAATSKAVEWQAEAISLFQGPSPTTMKIANGGSISVDYFITNQFGVVPAGDYQVAVTRARASGNRSVSDMASWAYNYPVASTGRVTVAITDNGSATVEGTDTVTVQLQKKPTAGTGFTNVTDASASKTFSLVYETDLKTPKLETTVNNNGSKRGTANVKALALEEEALRNFDSRVDTTAALEFAAFNAFTSTTATTATELVAITGYVKTAAGVGITQVPVVISGAGLMFSDGASGTATTVRHSLDSMILTTGTGGAYTFYVRGNLSGAKNVTVTAAGVTNTVTLTFAAGSTNAANMAITVPATSNPGKVVDVVVKLTDAKGNPASGVDVTFKSRGVGYLNALSGTSDADGEVIVKLITLTNDSGTATITATATLAGVSTAKSATVTVGTTPAEVNAVIGSFQGRWAVRVENAKGSTVTVRVGGNWFKYTALNDNYLFSRASRVGATVAVSVWVDGELQNSQTITVK